MPWWLMALLTLYLLFGIAKSLLYIQRWFHESAVHTNLGCDRFCGHPVNTKEY